jgi:hypothetical protein
MDSPPIVASFSNSDELHIGGARYLPASNIARTHGCSRDYVARLCRSGKVRGRRLAGIWYVDTEFFSAFVRRNENTSGWSRLTPRYGARQAARPRCIQSFFAP